MIPLSESQSKQKISVSLDESVIERIEEIPGVKRSTLLNDIAEEWLDENGY